MSRQLPDVRFLTDDELLRLPFGELQDSLAALLKDGKISNKAALSYATEWLAEQVPGINFPPDREDWWTLVQWCRVVEDYGIPKGDVIETFQDAINAQLSGCRSRQRSKYSYHKAREFIQRNLSRTNPQGQAPKKDKTDDKGKPGTPGDKSRYRGDVGDVDDDRRQPAAHVQEAQNQHAATDRHSDGAELLQNSLEPPVVNLPQRVQRSMDRPAGAGIHHGAERTYNDPDIYPSSELHLPAAQAPTQVPTQVPTRRATSGTVSYHYRQTSVGKSTEREDRRTGIRSHTNFSGYGSQQPESNYLPRQQPTTVDRNRDNLPVGDENRPFSTSSFLRRSVAGSPSRAGSDPAYPTRKGELSHHNKRSRNREKSRRATSSKLPDMTGPKKTGSNLTPLGYRSRTSRDDGDSDGDGGNERRRRHETDPGTARTDGDKNPPRREWEMEKRRLKERLQRSKERDAQGKERSKTPLDSYRPQYEKHFFQSSPVKPSSQWKSAPSKRSPSNEGRLSPYSLEPLGAKRSRGASYVEPENTIDRRDFQGKGKVQSLFGVGEPASQRKSMYQEPDSQEVEAKAAQEADEFLAKLALEPAIQGKSKAQEADSEDVEAKAAREADEFLAKLALELESRQVEPSKRQNTSQGASQARSDAATAGPGGASNAGRKASDFMPVVPGASHGSAGHEDSSKPAPHQTTAGPIIPYVTQMPLDRDPPYHPFIQNFFRNRDHPYINVTKRKTAAEMMDIDDERKQAEMEKRLVGAGDGGGDGSGGVEEGQIVEEDQAEIKHLSSNLLKNKPGEYHDW